MTTVPPNGLKASRDMLVSLRDQISAIIGDIDRLIVTVGSFPELGSDVQVRGAQGSLELQAKMPTSRAPKGSIPQAIIEIADAEPERAWSTQELARAVAARLGVREDSVRGEISRMAGRGELVQLRRGYYQSIKAALAVDDSAPQQPEPQKTSPPLP